MLFGHDSSNQVSDGNIIVGEILFIVLIKSFFFLYKTSAAIVYNYLIS